MTSDSQQKDNFSFFRKVVTSFSYAEKVLFWTLTAVGVLSLVLLLVGLNQNIMVTVPKHGGVLREGIVGAPRFMNPVLAQSDTDLDIVQLVYSGLMRQNKNGELIPDIAQSYEVSEDGLEYTFTLRDDAKFHDGVPVTADDVIFTIVAIQDPVIKSPRRSNWDGITVQKIDDRTVSFRLAEPYTPFIWNTTLGILPKHIWGDVSPEEFAFNTFNTQPIGTGPYEFENVRRDKSGTIRLIELEKNDDFVLGEPYISTIELHIFKNTEEEIKALNSDTIDAIAGFNAQELSDNVDNDMAIVEVPMNRLFGVFFNQNQAQILAKKYIREALRDSIDRDSVIEQALYGYATPAYGPIPEVHTPFETLSSTSTEAKNAKEDLKGAGWEENEQGLLVDDADDESSPTIAISLSTTDVPELVDVASIIVESWRNNGIDASLKVFDVNDIRQNVIRPREYDALLFGEVIDPSLDLYAFWHSSQRNDPGLNIANYTNISVDRALEHIRSGSGDLTKDDYLTTVLTELDTDVPAIFLYSPHMVYVVPQSLEGLSTYPVTRTSDRFSNVYTWYLETDRIWKFLAK